MIKEAKSAAKRQYIESLKQTILNVGIANKLTGGKVEFPPPPTLYGRLADTKLSRSGCYSLDPTPQTQSGIKSPVPLTQVS